MVFAFGDSTKYYHIHLYIFGSTCISTASWKEFHIDASILVLLLLFVHASYINLSYIIFTVLLIYFTTLVQSIYEVCVICNMLVVFFAVYHLFQLYGLYFELFYIDTRWYLYSSWFPLESLRVWFDIYSTNHVC